MFANLWAWASTHPLQFAIALGVAFYVITGVANWLTFPDDPKEWERIQREEPRHAGVILVLRGWGFYPAKTWRGLVAVVTGKLVDSGSKPPNVPPLPLLCLALALVSLGCAGSFEEARLVGLKTAPPMAKAAAADRSPDLEQYCRELDERRIRAGAIAKGAGVVAGVAGAGAGISEALVDAPKGVALGAAGLGVAAGAAAAYEVVTAEGLGAAWARSCTP